MPYRTDVTAYEASILKTLPKPASQLTGQFRQDMFVNRFVEYQKLELNKTGENVIILSDIGREAMKAHN